MNSRDLPQITATEILTPYPPGINEAYTEFFDKAKALSTDIETYKKITEGKMGLPDDLATPFKDTFNSFYQVAMNVIRTSINEANEIAAKIKNMQEAGIKISYEELNTYLSKETRSLEMIRLDFNNRKIRFKNSLDTDMDSKRKEIVNDVNSILGDFAAGAAATALTAVNSSARSPSPFTLDQKTEEQEASTTGTTSSAPSASTSVTSQSAADDLDKQIMEWRKYKAKCEQALKKIRGVLITTSNKSDKLKSSTYAELAKIEKILVGNINILNKGIISKNLDTKRMQTIPPYNGLIIKLKAEAIITEVVDAAIETAINSHISAVSHESTTSAPITIDSVASVQADQQYPSEIVSHPDESLDVPLVIDTPAASVAISDTATTVVIAASTPAAEDSTTNRIIATANHPGNVIILSLTPNNDSLKIDDPSTMTASIPVGAASNLFSQTSNATNTKVNSLSTTHADTNAADEANKTASTILTSIIEAAVKKAETNKLAAATAIAKNEAVSEEQTSVSSNTLATNSELDVNLSMNVTEDGSVNVAINAISSGYSNPATPTSPTAEFAAGAAGSYSASGSSQSDNEFNSAKEELKQVAQQIEHAKAYLEKRLTQIRVLLPTKEPKLPTQIDALLPNKEPELSIEIETIKRNIGYMQSKQEEIRAIESDLSNIQSSNDLETTYAKIETLQQFDSECYKREADLTKQIVLNHCENVLKNWGRALDQITGILDAVLDNCVDLAHTEKYVNQYHNLKNIKQILENNIRIANDRIRQASSEILPPTLTNEVLESISKQEHESAVTILQAAVIEAEAVTSANDSTPATLSSESETDTNQLKTPDHLINILGPSIEGDLSAKVSLFREKLDLYTQQISLALELSSEERKKTESYNKKLRGNNERTQKVNKVLSKLNRFVSKIRESIIEFNQILKRNIENEIQLNNAMKALTTPEQRLKFFGPELAASFRELDALLPDISSTTGVISTATLLPPQAVDMPIPACTDQPPVSSETRNVVVAAAAPATSLASAQWASDAASAYTNVSPPATLLKAAAGTQPATTAIDRTAAEKSAELAEKAKSKMAELEKTKNAIQSAKAHIEKRHKQMIILGIYSYYIFDGMSGIEQNIKALTEAEKKIDEIRSQLKLAQSKIKIQKSHLDIASVQNELEKLKCDFDLSLITTYKQKVDTDCSNLFGRAKDLITQWGPEKSVYIEDQLATARMVIDKCKQTDEYKKAVANVRQWQNTIRDFITEVDLRIKQAKILDEPSASNVSEYATGRGELQEPSDLGIKLKESCDILIKQASLIKKSRQDKEIKLLDVLTQQLDEVNVTLSSSQNLPKTPVANNLSFIKAKDALEKTRDILKANVSAQEKVIKNSEQREDEEDIIDTSTSFAAGAAATNSTAESSKSQITPSATATSSLAASAAATNSTTESSQPQITEDVVKSQIREFQKQAKLIEIFNLIQIQRKYLEFWSSQTNWKFLGGGHAYPYYDKGNIKQVINIPTGMAQIFNHINNYEKDPKKYQPSNTLFRPSNQTESLERLLHLLTIEAKTRRDNKTWTRESIVHDFYSAIALLDNKLDDVNTLDTVIGELKAVNNKMKEIQSPIREDTREVFWHFRRQIL